METSFKPELPSIKVAENGVSWQGHAGSERGLAASRRSSGQDVRLAWVDLESEDEGAETFKFSWRRLFLHMGPGFLMCIAFIDPGNLESDLQAGAHTGYSLLWVLLWSTVMGYLLQALAAKLGVATGKHLAEQCRANYPPAVRLVLWLMAELAIIGSDIQEVIGTAIAIRLLSGGRLPLYAGVIVAAVSAYVLLFLERLGIRHLEAFFQLLIAVMSVSFGYMFFAVDVPYADVARGMVVPHLSRDTVSVACGILGSVIMPHNLFLHSALVHSRKVHSDRPARKAESVLYYSIEAAAALVVTLFINLFVVSVFARGFYGKTASEDIGLENAAAYLGAAFGRHMEVVWAVGLLAAGQSSTMTGTYAGQFVMTGFLNLKISAFLRTLISRAVAICPTLLVALRYRSQSTKMDDLNQWLNVLQSVQLPFAVIPLLMFTSDPRIMGRRFSNRPLTAATCWAIAAAIIAVNTSVAYQAAVTHLPEVLWVHVGFWSAVGVYLLFLGYLMLSPARVAGWWQLLRGVKPAEEEPGAMGYYALGGGDSSAAGAAAAEAAAAEAAARLAAEEEEEEQLGGLGSLERLGSEVVRYQIQGDQILRLGSVPSPRWSDMNGAGGTLSGALQEPLLLQRQQPEQQPEQ